MRWMSRFRIVVLTAAVLATTQLKAAPQDDLMTLDQAIALALQNNRAIKNAQLEVNKAGDQVAATRTRRLPSFSSYTLGSRQLSHADLRFDRGAFGVFNGIGPVPAEDTTIKSPGRFSTLIVNQITQPLSQQKRIGIGIRQAQIGAAMAAQQLRAEQHSVIAGVRSTYYAIVQTQSSLRATEQNIRLYRELDRVTEQYVLQRVSLKSESLDVKTRLARNELDALKLQDSLATQKEQLNGLLGRDLSVDFSVSDAIEVRPASLELPQAQSLALTHRPEIVQAKLKIDQAEADRRSKRSEFIPDISLNFSNTTPINYSSSLPKNITSVGIAVDWEIFDWGRKKRELSAKDAAVVQARNALSEAESQVTREVNSNYRKLQRASQMLRIATLGQQTATEVLRVAADGYRAEAALLKDVLQSEAALAQANDQYQQALVSFWTAKSDFEKSLGDDHE